MIWLEQMLPRILEERKQAPPQTQEKPKEEPVEPPHGETPSINQEELQPPQEFTGPMTQTSIEALGAQMRERAEPAEPR